MTDLDKHLVTPDNWQELSFAMLRSKELSPAAKGALHVWLKMDKVKAAQEAHALHVLMHARLMEEIEK